MLRFLFTLLLLAALLVGGFVWLNRVSFLEDLLSKALHTEVSIDKVTVRWNEIELHNMKMNRFKSQLVTIKAPFSNFFKKKIVIDRLCLEDATLRVALYNASGTENNWSGFLRTAKREHHSGKPVVIQEVHISRLQCQMCNAKKQEVAVPLMNSLELHQLGATDPLTGGEVSGVIVQTILKLVGEKVPIKRGNIFS